MNILMITQELDPASSNMRVAHDWAAAIAARCDQLTVLASRVRSPHLPTNVTVIALRRSEEGARLPVILRLCWHFLRLVATGRVDVVFAHMAPSFALLAWPFCKLGRRPLALWYTSHGLTRSLRLAHRLIDLPLTASADSYPVPDSFPVVLGHGIDTARLRDSSRSPDDPPVISLAARLTPLKQVELIICALADPALRNHSSQPVVEIAGEPFYPADRGYLAGLKSEVDRLDLGSRVTFLGGVSGADMPALYGRSTLTVSCRAAPSLDKSALESLAAGVPVVTNNPSFAYLLGPHAANLLFAGDDPSILAGRLARLLDDSDARERIAADLTDKVERAHGLDGFADRLIDVLRALVRGRAPGVAAVENESKDS